MPAATLLTASERNLNDGMSEAELAEAPTLAARTVIETEPDLTSVAARWRLDAGRCEAITSVAGAPEAATWTDLAKRYASDFPACVMPASPPQRFRFRRRRGRARRPPVAGRTGSSARSVTGHQQATRSR